MSAEAETKPAGNDWPVMPPESGWSWKKICFLIALAFVAHLTFIFVFGAKKTPGPKAVGKVPHFQFANQAGEWIALDDPTLFALPHVEDFAPAVWRNTPTNRPPPFRWTEAPSFLAPAVEALGLAFGALMQSNQIAALPLNFKPEPKMTIANFSVESMLPKNSTLEIAGDIVQRKLLTPASVPTLAYPDVIAPSKIQILVDATGKVISAVSLPSDNPLESADRADIGESNALNIARSLRFTPMPGVTFGQLIFNWHTVPTNAP